MKRGIVLSLDPRLDAHVRTMWEAFEKAGVGITPGRLLETPHITIAEASSESIEPLWAASIETEFADGDLHLVPFGVFLGKKHILFYNVVLSEGLHRSYTSFYELLRQKKAAYNPLYDPSHILFHCTIAVDVEEQELAHAVELVSKERKSLSGSVVAIEFWEHFPTRRIKGKKLAPKTATIDDGILE
jgi:2'-5' RNA ligase